MVAGFSQGPIAAILANSTDARVKEVYAMRSFRTYAANYNIASCMNDGKHALASKNLRIVNGEWDIFVNNDAAGARGDRAVTWPRLGLEPFR